MGDGEGIGDEVLGFKRLEESVRWGVSFLRGSVFLGISEGDMFLRG